MDVSPQSQSRPSHVPTLLELASRVVIQNIECITSLADLPVRLAIPIINRVNNPDQLLQIEKTSPQLVGHTAEAWKRLIRRDIPKWQEIIETTETSDWGKIYRKYKRQDEHVQQVLAVELREKYRQVELDKQRKEPLLIKDVILPSTNRNKTMKMLRKAEVQQKSSVSRVVARNMPKDIRIAARRTAIIRPNSFGMVNQAPGRVINEYSFKHGLAPVTGVQNHFLPTNLPPKTIQPANRTVKYNPFRGGTDAVAARTNALLKPAIRKAETARKAEDIRKNEARISSASKKIILPRTKSSTVPVSLNDENISSQPPLSSATINKLDTVMMSEEPPALPPSTTTTTTSTSSTNPQKRKPVSIFMASNKRARKT